MSKGQEKSSKRRRQPPSERAQARKSERKEEEKTSNLCDHVSQSELPEVMMRLGKVNNNWC
jgi:hypothetical protein